MRAAIAARGRAHREQRFLVGEQLENLMGPRARGVRTAPRKRPREHDACEPEGEGDTLLRAGIGPKGRAPPCKAAGSCGAVPQGRAVLDDSYEVEPNFRLRVLE